LIISEATQVAANGIGYPNTPGIYNQLLQQVVTPVKVVKQFCKIMMLIVLLMVVCFSLILIYPNALS
jgi:hypothetical protein